MSSVNNEQDLGVTIDNELKFSNDTKRSATGASSTMGLIKCTISTCSLKVISLLYKELVHPKLEVGMSLASPYFKKDIKFVGICRDIPLVISGMQELSYPVRLSKLNLPTFVLVYRKNRGDTILPNKLLRNSILPALFLICWYQCKN